ncbi:MULTISPECIES: DJ-1/PfpI family protein [unclassified Variovorax]|uniref:DJ-1/PfpI family protein n=1 Tax=unclassified Variovorax TaxID=663243 RepID=UPI0008396003|nr:MULTISPECIES: DJ-1/PfpI family protein [unclassified Variovorax]PNG53084.1 Isonitrile hydratase [Variovorax sp. B2]PNG53656.1 Isonitrile hydratase [Variovorax sp. B4]VTV11093.1 Isonitrile hydratase [Variovorax sp. WDL1]
MTNALQIGFLVFPKVTQLDLMGPAQVLSRVPGAKVHLAWKAIEPLVTDVGFSVNPTVTFAECPQLDVLCVPGGFGVVEQLNDAVTMEFLRGQGRTARYVTSVCNGSLLLGAAGLIQGYKSACHWMWRHYLPQFGAEPVAARVVRDRNRLSGGGVTSGIDFAFTLAAELAGEEAARMIQLGLEYDPQPPLDSGSPDKAGPERVARARAAGESSLPHIEAQIAQAARRLLLEA